MTIKVYPHKTEIEKEPINEKEINVTEINFEFSSEIEDELTKEAYFTCNGTTYKEIIVNNKCDIPYEVIENQGQVEIGVVAYEIQNEEYVKRYNPSPVYVSILSGSYKENAENSQPITPSELEQFEQALNDGLRESENVDIDAIKQNGETIVTVTNRRGIEKVVYILDGQKGDKGDKGDTGERGLQGETGPQGPQGERGIQGEQGVKGDTGASGRDGYKQYSAGENITIENDTISATVPEIDLSNYYTKSQIDGMIGNINSVLATLTTVEEG